MKMGKLKHFPIFLPALAINFATFKRLINLQVLYIIEDSLAAGFTQQRPMARTITISLVNTQY